MLTPVPCPKCGSDDLSIDCYDTMRYSYTYVQCNSCLRLVKTMGANGQYKYAVTKTESDELLSKFKSIFAQSVVSADFAGNIIAIRCYTGMAQAACAAFDSMHWEGLVGTLAGDDTIFALCRSESYASQMKDSIKRLIEK